MAAIAGIADPDGQEKVNQMLKRLAHRGGQGSLVKSLQGFTVGVCWPTSQPGAEQALLDQQRVEDAVSDSHFASAQITGNVLTLSRDPFGVSPLYYGFSAEKALCFASEVKALVGLVQQVHEVPPGSSVTGGVSKPYYQLTPQPALQKTRLEMAAELRGRLVKAVEKRARRGIEYGAWLSGGLDSSILAAIAQDVSHGKMHTFAAGFSDASDLAYARIIARHLRTQHHEVIPTIKDVMKAIPEVIYHLESFDLFLVRSSLMNYFVAKLAANYVPAIFSGEGSDELFGGYPYLRKMPFEALSSELIDIIGRLHNTSLQRTDRCSAAFGTITYVPFLDQEIVDYALQIPAEHKLYDGHQKWILRRAVYDLLPQSVVNREEEKFWEGAGIRHQMASMAEEAVSDSDFRRLRALPNGETLRSKEEAYYYQIFQEYFGALDDFSWTGRTKDSANNVVP
jgi:asparagine synthase (glutamine-hydrolysing)